MDATTSLTNTETAISLFVESQKKDNDNLRKFIASWSALELLINKLSKSVRSKWEILLRDRGKLPDWDKDLTEISYKEYRMRDRFLSVACVLDWDSADKDINQFITINSIRSEFYHRGNISEEKLPADDAQQLFRKYLLLAFESEDFVIKGDGGINN